MPFYGGTRRTLLYAPTSGVLLPRVGPFATLGRVSASSQPNILTNGTLINSSRLTPYKANSLQFQGFNQPDTSTSGLALFFWANVVSFPFGSFLYCPGSQGFEGSVDLCGNIFGGSGGNGASGGGGGGTIDAGICATGQGGSGGSFSDGASGDAPTGGVPGSGGLGQTGPANYNSGFTYGSGSDGQTSPSYPDGAAGIGGNGYGGGGAGGSAYGGCEAGAGGGGGGGGGLVCLVANQVIGTNGSVDCTGGPGIGSGGAAEGGWPGGDGVFYMAAKAYNGALNVFANAYIWEIKRDGSLVSRTAADSWNNL